MAQLGKSTKDFEIFGAQPWPGYFMKPATTSADNGAFLSSKIDFRTGMYLDTIPPQKLIFEFALRAQKITILGALVTQFHEMSGLAQSG
jgi:hypothetical protein